MIFKGAIKTDLKEIQSVRRVEVSPEGSYLVLQDDNYCLSFYDLDFEDNWAKSWNNSFKDKKIVNFSIDCTGRYIIGFRNYKIEVYDLHEDCSVIKSINFLIQDHVLLDFKSISPKSFFAKYRDSISLITF